MGRHTKTKPLTPRREEFLECYYSTRSWPVPRSAYILKKVVGALLLRFRTIDPAGSREIEILLQQMAAREWHLEHYPDRYKQEQGLEAKGRAKLAFEISQIAHFRTATNPAHHRSTLCRQRDVLGWFLTNYPFPWKERAKRRNWIETHSAAVIDAIGVFLCTCRYPKVIKAEYKIRTHIHSIDDCSTAGRLNSFILGAMHDIAPSHVQNLLKPSRTPH